MSFVMSARALFCLGVSFGYVNFVMFKYATLTCAITACQYQCELCALFQRCSKCIICRLLAKDSWGRGGGGGGGGGF